MEPPTSIFFLQQRLQSTLITHIVIAWNNKNVLGRVNVHRFNQVFNKGFYGCIILVPIVMEISGDNQQLLSVLQIMNGAGFLQQDVFHTIRLRVSEKMQISQMKNLYHRFSTSFICVEDKTSMDRLYTFSNSRCRIL